MQTKKLTLWQATFIIINIMFGSGIFINTVNLIHLTGFFGFVSYSIVACILFPLILSIAALLKKYPAGGFYTYADQELGTVWGFLSSWSYFVGKIASTTLLVHIFSLLIQTIIPQLQPINLFIMDGCILALFIWLNYYGLKTSARISDAFLFLKVTPILFTILSCLYLVKYWHVPSQALLWHNIPHSIPLVLYAFLGFEAACAISLTIENAKQNAARVVLYSFGFTIVITIVYQFLVFLALGNTLLHQNSFLDLFPTLFAKLTPHSDRLSMHLVNLFHIAGAASALGGAYGMLFSNAWNLYTLAENNHIVYAKRLIKKNAHGVPFLCFIAEALVCLVYLFATKGNQIILQQISVFGVSISLTLSVLSLLKLQFIDKQYYAHTLTPIFGITSCVILLATCLHNLVNASLYFFTLFAGLLSIGLVMYILKNIKKGAELTAPIHFDKQ